MYIVYFDEVKHQLPVQPYCWLGGIVVRASDIRDLEAQVGEVAREYLGASLLGKDTEFHAAEIFHRKGVFKEWKDIDRRTTLLRRLIRVLDRHDTIGKVYVRLDPARMIATDRIEQRAFMFFVERVDMALQDRKGVGLLIGDFEHDRISTAAAVGLSGFRAEGTPYQFGRAITHLIDTVHFSHSHLSRMLQLADLYVWTLQLCASTPSGDPGPRGELADFVRSETRLLHAHRFKEWPTVDSWIQVQPAPR